MENREELLIQFGKHLENIRKDKGISQSELARLCLMERQHIHRFEKGLVNPTFLNLYKISTALHISIEELMKGFEFIEE